MTYDVVIPTLGRPSLAVLLRALAAGQGPSPGRVVLVADGTAVRVPGDLPSAFARCVQVVDGPGAGPAAARNVGWRRCDGDWIAFLDDDVVPADDWPRRLTKDLAGLSPAVAGSQGCIDVPLPEARPPTDWERNVKGLERAVWATADMAYRRNVLEAVGGFDERFPRAYREDADLALRIRRAGYALVRGERRVMHPVRPAGRWASVAAQAGNADDVLMRPLHGRGWRADAQAPKGRAARHAATAAAAIAAAGLAAAGRRRAGAAALAAWLGGTAELAWSRIAPGPRTREEVTTMLLTSVAIPFAATYHRLAGLARLPRLFGVERRGPKPARLDRPSGPPCQRPDAVLLDRDGTLVVDEPYNGDPARVVPMPGAEEALALLRAAGIATAVVSNQSGVARGLLSAEQLSAVNRRVEQLLGPVGPWLVCTHGPDEGCDCRKPAPGLILRAAEKLGVQPERCAVIGDIGSDVEAARAAGARAVLVPTPRTRPEEIDSADEVAPDLPTAVERLLGDPRCRTR